VFFQFAFGSDAYRKDNPMKETGKIGDPPPPPQT
jgi:hypothetical protein